MAFLGINLGYSSDTAAALIDQSRVTYPTALDIERASLWELGGVALPATAFISEEGEVLEVHTGLMTVEAIDERLAGYFFGTGNLPPAVSREEILP